MTKQKTQQHDYTLVVGLGVTGLSVVRYLTRIDERVVVVDSRDIPPGLQQLKNEFPYVECHTGGFQSKLFTSAHRIVLSPGVPLYEPEVRQANDAGVEISGDLDLFANVVSAPVVGITGSNGKSTVTTLVGEMAKQAGINVAVGGNIGTPVLDLLQNDYELYVLELSSFQLETLHNLPMVASVVLNVSPDHLDRYVDVASYALCKQTIYNSTKNAVVNLDDDVASANVISNLDTDKQVVSFSLSKPGVDQFGVTQNPKDGAQWLCFGEEFLLPVKNLKIKGEHNVLNALAALALGSCINLPMDSMLKALVDFSGLPHRTQWIAELNEVNWFNDSKATNVGATIAAIKGLPGKHILIAGGDGKGADFSGLREVADEYLRKVILIGKDAGLIDEALSGVVSCERANDMQSAVLLARQAACPGDNVLLSPACASLDMYKNFEERGDSFVAAIKEMLR